MGLLVHILDMAVLPGDFKVWDEWLARKCRGEEKGWWIVMSQVGWTFVDRLTRL